MTPDSCSARGSTRSSVSRDPPRRGRRRCRALPRLPPARRQWTLGPARSPARPQFCPARPPGGPPARDSGRWRRCRQRHRTRVRSRPCRPSRTSASCAGPGRTPPPGAPAASPCRRRDWCRRTAPPPARGPPRSWRLPWTRCKPHTARKAPSSHRSSQRLTAEYGGLSAQECSTQ